MKVFSRDLFSFHNISVVLFHISKTKFDWPDWTQSGLWIGYGFCSVSGYDRLKIDPHASIAKFPKSVLLFHNLWVFWAPNSTPSSYLWNRITSSPATLLVLNIMQYSVGWSCVVIGAQIQVWDFVSMCNHHWLSRQSLKWNKSEKRL